MGAKSALIIKQAIKKKEHKNHIEKEKQYFFITKLLVFTACLPLIYQGSFSIEF